VKRIVLGALKYYLKNESDKCAAVILAAGSSRRMNGVDKMYAEICEMPVLIHTLNAFEHSDCISEIVLVVRSEDIETASVICSDYGITKLKCVVAGGASRAMSSYNGVSAVSDGIGIIAIHDGARPLVPQNVITEAVASAKKYSTGVAAIPVASTLKRVENGAVAGSVGRTGLYEIQTPQVFQADLIKAALENAVKKSLELTDDSSAVEFAGIPVRITTGSSVNIKITTQSDLVLAEAVLRGRGCQI